MVRTARAKWQAEDLDPHLIFRIARWRARYFVVEVSSDEELDPHIFLDIGYGFRSEFEVKLAATRHGVYLIKMSGFGRIRRVRFDPCTGRAAFDVKAITAFTKKAAIKMLGDSAGLLQFVEERTQIESPPPQKIANPAEFYKGICDLAAVNFTSSEANSVSAISPVISFVAPVYNTPPAYLDDLLNSFKSQSAENWELILSDDGSTRRATLKWLDRHVSQAKVRVLRSENNMGIGIATNRGVQAARGEWIGLIDHDDALSPFAIACLNDALRHHPQMDFIYTDEVIADARLKPSGFFFKPAFDPVLLSGVNYINHLSLYRRGRLIDKGGVKAGYDGSQDYELLLRYLSGLNPRCVLHVPFPAYIWRRDGASYSARFLDAATASARRALGEAYANGGRPCPVEPALAPDLHRLRFDHLHDAWPTVSVIIPNRDSFALISRLLSDLTQRTDYPALEIIVVDNGTTDNGVLRLYEEFRQAHANFRVDLHFEPFNFARQTNRGLRMARGAALLLLNNDIEVQDPSWLKEMVSCLDYADVGIVGARLLYPSGRLQHAGVILGLSGLAGHWYSDHPASTAGPMSRLKVRQSLSAVTGACMLVSRTCHEATGLLDEDAFAVAFNDVDFCLRAAAFGFRTVWTPFATLTHHESVTRGSDETDANKGRFQYEKTMLRLRHQTDKRTDPAFSAWYSTHHNVPKEILVNDLPIARTWGSPLPSLSEQFLDGLPL